MQNKEKNLNIGMVNFINTAPIYETWKSRPHPATYHVVEGAPSTLNRMLAEDKLDLGFVSSCEYGHRPEKYFILSDLSISANGSVGSVFLFSKREPKQLTGKTVLLSGQSETSIALVKIILEEFYHVQPDYIVGDVRSQSAEQAEGVLAIGDEALRLADAATFKHKLDLGEVWRRFTDLPFVFAVCAVRRDFCKKYPEQVNAVHREFILCVQEGQEELPSICVRVAPRIPMHPDECYVYLRAIEYDLDEKKIMALEKFFTFLINRGELPENAVPLCIQNVRTGMRE